MASQITPANGTARLVSSLVSSVPKADVRTHGRWADVAGSAIGMLVGAQLMALTTSPKIVMEMASQITPANGTARLVSNLVSSVPKADVRTHGRWADVAGSAIGMLVGAQ